MPIEISKGKMVTVGDLIALARGLRSDDGENVEYDRALVELIADVVYSAGDNDTRAAVTREVLGA
jgi:hypothetical protein